MPVSAFTPDITVELGLGSGYSTPLASISWTDVSAYVEAQFGVQITRGRSDEFSDVQPSRLTLTLDNRDGRFTPLYASGAYYPNVKKGVPIRVSATWPLGGGGTTYRRFTGHVDEWPVDWPLATSGSSHATVTASSRMARLGRNAELSNIVAQEILADSPAAYWMLGEAEGSVRAASSAATPQRPLRIATLGTGGTLTFAGGDGSAFDGMSALSTNPNNLSDGKYLWASWTEDLDPSQILIEFFFSAPAGSNPQMFCGFGGPATNVNVGLTSAAGHIEVAESSAGGPTLICESTGGVNYADGEIHHVAVKLRDTGANHDVGLYVDGAPVSAAFGYFTNAQVATMFSAGKTVYVGRAQNDDNPEFGEISSIGHVAVFATGAEIDDVRIASHARAGLSGFSADAGVAERSDERLERIAGWAGVPAAEISTEIGNTLLMSFQDTSGQSPVQAMFDVVHTENGLLFDAGDGTLTFHARGHRYGAASALTLSAATQQLEADLQPKMDDFGLINDITVDTPSYSVRVIDTTSADDHGEYKATINLLTTDDFEADDAANYKIAKYADPLVRVPNATVQVIAQPSADVTAILAVELGDLVTLSGLPSQAPASSMDFFVEGYTETIGLESWLWQANLSPGDIPGDVWILGTSLLGTDTVLGY